MRRVASVHFVRPVPVLDTGRLQDRFAADEHWIIDTSDIGGSPWVRLSRPAVPERNVPEVGSFIVRGVGFAEPTEEHDEARETAAKGDESGKQAPVDAGAGAKDAGDPPAGGTGAGTPGPHRRGPRKVKT